MYIHFLTRSKDILMVFVNPIFEHLYFPWFLLIQSPMDDYSSKEYPLRDRKALSSNPPGMSQTKVFKNGT